VTFVALPPPTARGRPRPRKIQVAKSVEPDPSGPAQPKFRQSDSSKAADPQAALLHDQTLKAGDVVVFADGPKVFKGRSRAPYQVSDFEDVLHSRAVSKKVQRQLLAMTGHLAKPADELRQYATLPRSETAPDEVTAEQHASSVRVVYPGYR
jgi:hypothetical protein